MADALGPQIQPTPNRFRRARLARVSSKAHAMVGGPEVRVAEKFGRSFLLVAPNADAGDFAVMIADGKLEDFLRSLSHELADRIENPHQRNAEVSRAPGAPAIQAVEDGREILFTPEANPD